MEVIEILTWLHVAKNVTLKNLIALHTRRICYGLSVMVKYVLMECIDMSNHPLTVLTPYLTRNGLRLRIWKGKRKGKESLFFTHSSTLSG